MTFDVEGVSETDALIVNVQETGFYRVNYDADNWNKISATLQTDLSAIHKVNRAQVMNDVFALAQNAMLDYDLALDQTKYLSTETDYIPWSAGLSGFSYLQLMLR